MDNVTALAGLVVRLEVVSHKGSGAEGMVWPCSVPAAEQELSPHRMLQPPQRQLHQPGLEEGWRWSCCWLCCLPW